MALVQPAQIARKFWWIFAVRGIFAIAFGILVLMAPPLAAGLMILWVIGIYFLVDGLASLLQAFAAKDTGIPAGWWVFQGIVSIAAGIAVLVWPAATAVVLLYLLAFWALAIGLTILFSAFGSKISMGARIFTMILGLAITAFGVSLLVGGTAEGLTRLITLVGIWSLVTGVMMIGTAFAIRSSADKILDAQPTGVQ